MLSPERVSAPLTLDQLSALAQEHGGSRLQCYVAVSLGTLLSGCEALNDYVSEVVTGYSGTLMDLGYTVSGTDGESVLLLVDAEVDFDYLGDVE